MTIGMPFDLTNVTGNMDRSAMQPGANLFSSLFSAPMPQAPAPPAAPALGGAPMNVQPSAQGQQPGSPSFLDFLKQLAGAFGQGGAISNVFGGAGPFGGAAAPGAGLSAPAPPALPPVNAFADLMKRPQGGLY